MAEIASATAVARTVADALEAARVPYAIGGAIAYGMYGPPRATNDVDVTVFVDAGRLAPVFDALAGIGATLDRGAAAARAHDRGDFQATVGGLRVDVFVPSIPFYESAEKRVRRAVLGGRPVTILAPEDLAVFKLLFFRTKDVLDLERLVAIQGGTLDAGYVRRWIVDMCGENDARVKRWDAIVATARP